MTMAITSFFFFFRIDGKGINLKNENKMLLEAIVHYANKVIYDKAEEYNPKGDAVPDALDDQLKEKIKESIR